MGGSFDVVVGSTGSDTLYGCADDDFIFGDFDGGIRHWTHDDDVLFGDGGTDEIYGDAVQMEDGSVGGNDVLNGGSEADFLVGDAYYLYGSTGGDDTLNGGSGDDWLYGDGILDGSSTGGADVFIFDSDSGQDVIWDYESQDQVDISGWSVEGDGILSFDDTRNLSPDHVAVEGLTVSYNGDSIFFVGITNAEDIFLVT